MNKRGRLKPKHRRDGERRQAAGRDWSTPVLVFADWRPPREWLEEDSEAAMDGTRDCED